MTFRTVSYPLSLLFVFSSSVTAETLSGKWHCKGDDGVHSLDFQSNSTLIFDSETSAYNVMGNIIWVQDDDGISNYSYQIQGKQLLIQFPDGSMLDCQRGGKAIAPRPSTASPAKGTVDNATLKSEIAGTWWGYSGSTETKIGLCPGGRYVDYTESSYSGSSYDSGGDQTMAWGTAGQRGNSGYWSIQGDYQQGTISVQTDSGNQFTLKYSQVGEPGCLNISGKRLCRTSAQCE